MKLYSTIAKNYEHIFPYNPSQRDYILRCSGEKRSSVLEIGSAMGELLFNLETDFDEVYGCDLNSEMIDLAKEKKSEVGSKIKIEELNMLSAYQHYSPKKFDTVFSFGNTLVHLNNKEIEDFIKNIGTVIVPGGKLLIQIINYDRIIDQNLDFLPTIDNEKIKFERNYNFKNDSAIEFATKLLVKDSGDIISNSVDLTPIRCLTLVDLLRCYRFTNINLYGDFKMSEFGISRSVQLVICAEYMG